MAASFIGVVSGAAARSRAGKAELTGPDAAARPGARGGASRRAISAAPAEPTFIGAGAVGLCVADFAGFTVFAVFADLGALGAAAVTGVAVVGAGAVVVAVAMAVIFAAGVFFVGTAARPAGSAARVVAGSAAVAAFGNADSGTNVATNDAANAGTFLGTEAARAGASVDATVAARGTDCAAKSRARTSAKRGAGLLDATVDWPKDVDCGKGRFSDGASSAGAQSSCATFKPTTS